MTNHIAHIQSIKVKHNVEMAHRLSATPGKCENIHGHSWWITLTLTGPVDASGKVAEFGEVKRLFREHLDNHYDHHLLLSAHDPWAAKLAYAGYGQIPGATTTEGDPTTENLARWIWEWATHTFKTLQAHVEVWETSVNCATYP